MSQPTASNGHIHSNSVDETPTTTLSSIFVKLHQQLQEHRTGAPVVVDGKSITIAALTAAARYRTPVVLENTPAVRLEVQKSRDILIRKIESGKSVYGVSTGFGGSAVTRTRDYQHLGYALFQMQHCGILPSSPEVRSILPLSNVVATTSMPEAWTRAAMLIRMNSLVRGHSAIRWELLEAIENALNKDVVPVVPLRGSISASGDLSPLSYIAGMLMGNPSIRVYHTTGSGEQKTIPSRDALKLCGLKPLELQPKEHIGLLNGTSFSAAVSGLALYDIIHLALLTQICTAMSTEALLGSKGSFAPFVNEAVRPHPGQVETARTIHAFLSSSQLAAVPSGYMEKTIDKDRGVLKQDRYALRTSPQFIGPQIEDIQAALVAIHQELNSTTDNPLIETTTQTVHDTGNFQAMVSTNAMEKTRLSLHHLGKILFAQVTEMMNPATNNGLPPSLAATDPSLDYHCKGLEISMAAYVSELGFLANPVSTHIQSTEMHNQSVNSLALISARATITSIDVLTMLIAVCIYVSCQAFDLRALQFQLNEVFKEIISDVIIKNFGGLIPETEMETLFLSVLSAFREAFSNSSTLDGPERIRMAAKATTGPIMDYLWSHPNVPTDVTRKVPAYQAELYERCLESFLNLRARYLTDNNATSSTSAILGASREIYGFVRGTLGIRMYGVENLTVFRDGLNSKEPTIGENVSLIYEAIRDGHFHDIVAQMLQEVLSGYANGRPKSC